MPPRIRPTLQVRSPTAPSSSQVCSQCLSQITRRPSDRQFSSTPKSSTRLRTEMFDWLNGPGAVFRNPLPGSTNYLSAYTESGQLQRALDAKKDNPKFRRKGDEDEEGVPREDPQFPDQVDESNLPLEQRSDQNTAGARPIPKQTVDDLKPFPLNHNFLSQPVLSEELRQEIWKRVKLRGDSVRVVSAALGVEMRRVGAVVRLVELEREMIREGKPLAKPYAKAVLDMLPQTHFKQGARVQPHEPINDLPVHRLTQPQIFYPVAESRHFTRTDAGRVFSAAPRLIQPSEDGTDTFVQREDPSILKPADERIPHPQLILAQPGPLGSASSPTERTEKYKAWLKAEEEAIKARKEKAAEKERREVKKVVTERFEFRFRDVSVSRETVGLDGRGRKGVGSRYGVPSMERKRGTVKIPTSVEA